MFIYVMHLYILNSCLLLLRPFIYVSAALECPRCEWTNVCGANV